ncbi:unnamed protein product [Periconia digitata]|uniref:Uncharacterized protein n=1 Tax=Periconia digitata TaxID=1303443 RepID=A0A9W4UR75_9PLEO|nr:unnamed protein product [Periconia digitata]
MPPRPPKSADDNKTKVLISGLRGNHSLEVGIAYYYRGHHLYGPKGNPVMPMGFSTRQTITLSGLAPDFAPPYDYNDPTLLEETQIQAFDWAKRAEWKRQQAEGQSTATSNAEGEEEGVILMIQLASRHGDSDRPMQQRDSIKNGSASGSISFDLHLCYLIDELPS